MLGADAATGIGRSESRRVPLRRDGDGDDDGDDWPEANIEGETTLGFQGNTKQVLMAKGCYRDCYRLISPTQVLSCRW